jgi:hypothetical protein
MDEPNDRSKRIGSSGNRPSKTPNKPESNRQTDEWFGSAPVRVFRDYTHMSHIFENIDIEMPLHGNQVRRSFSLIISHINIDASREILHFLQFAIPNRLE